MACTKAKNQICSNKFKQKWSFFNKRRKWTNLYVQCLYYKVTCNLSLHSRLISFQTRTWMKTLYPHCGNVWWWFHYHRNIMGNSLWWFWMLFSGDFGVCHIVILNLFKGTWRFYNFIKFLKIVEQIFGNCDSLFIMLCINHHNMVWKHLT